MKRRILQVVWQMNEGGIAHWLMNVLRHVDRTRCHFDFLLLREGPCAFANEIWTLGSEVIPCYGHKNPWRIARGLAKAVHQYGPYDVIHSHVYNYSGIILKLAAHQGIPIRIAHSHTDARIDEAGQPPWRRLYLGLTKRWIMQKATVRLGVSVGAGEALYGSDWRRDPGARVVPPGLDLAPFGQSVDRGAVRRSLGLSADDLVIGHVGNHVWAKNHSFLIEIAAHIISREPHAKVLLIGHGLVDSAVQAKVNSLKLADRIQIIGARDDVPNLMLGAMDGFLFPSRYEGLGLVLLEAQSAGLPCVVSTGVPEEVGVIPDLIHRLPLSEAPSKWAAAMLEGIASRSTTQSEAYHRMLQSDFNIEKSVATLTRIYEMSPDVTVVPASTEVADRAH